MNIDQRLETLTHAVEMLVQRQNSFDSNLDRLFEMHTKNEQLQAKNEITMAQLMESVNSLARIAHAHENRITNLEDRQ